MQQFKSSQSNQPTPNPDHDRTEQPVVCPQRGASRSQEIETRSFREESVKHDRTGKPLKQEQPKHVHLMTARAPTLKINFNVGDETIHDRTGQPVVNRDESSHEQTMLNEVNMDFRIPGLPHSVVKHAQSTSVRELIKKIENHPGRHALRQDLRQNRAYNPFSAESMRMIQDVGNVELFELLETDSKTQCKACLSYWSAGVVYCTCGHL